MPPDLYDDEGAWFSVCTQSVHRSAPHHCPGWSDECMDECLGILLPCYLHSGRNFDRFNCGPTLGSLKHQNQK